MPSPVLDFCFVNTKNEPDLQFAALYLLTDSQNVFSVFPLLFKGQRFSGEFIELLKSASKQLLAQQQIRSFEQFDTRIVKPVLENLAEEGPDYVIDPEALSQIIRPNIQPTVSK
jgi:hypothetical protein